MSQLTPGVGGGVSGGNGAGAAQDIWNATGGTQTAGGTASANGTFTIAGFGNGGSVTNTFIGAGRRPEAGMEVELEAEEEFHQVAALAGYLPKKHLIMDTHHRHIQEEHGF